MVSLIEIHLGEECRTGSLCGATLVGLFHGQHLVGLLQFLGNNAPPLIIGIFGIGKLVIVFILKIGVHNERNVLVEPLQQEVAVGTQKLHLGKTLLLERKALVAFLQHTDG